MCQKSSTFAAGFEIYHLFLGCRDGGIGRHEGLKILWPVMAVWVQVPLAVRKDIEYSMSLFVFFILFLA